MMRSRYLAAVVIFSIVFFGALSSTTSALMIETNETNFLLESPVQVSAYGWQLEGPSGELSSNNPFLLQYIQLYNDSDRLVDLRDWKVFVQDPLGARTEIVLSSEFSGWVEPHKHVIAGFGDVVLGATFHFEKTSLPSLTQPVKSKLVVAPTIAGIYRDAEYELKYTSAFWQRNLSSTGVGYVSTFTGTVNPPAALADDGTYTVPLNPALSIEEIYSYSSTCAPNDMSILCGDYIKLRLTADTQDLSQYVLRTDSNSGSRTSSNTFYLSDYPVLDNGYITVALDEDGERVGLTNSGGYVWIEDLYGTKVYKETMTRYDAASSDHQGWAWMHDADAVWKWTTTPQPSLPNVFTVPAIEAVEACPTGKYLNPETNRCRTIEEAVNALAACPEGQERNPVTNRCRAKVLAASAVLTPCSEGQERNPLTNRCRSIASAVAELLPCDEGYERNPATNRCRKSTSMATLAGAAPLGGADKVVGNADTNTWGWALAAVAATGALSYGVYEWRHEIAKGWRWMLSRMVKK